MNTVPKPIYVCPTTLFRPAGRPTFSSRGKSRQKRLPLHPALASLRVRSLRRRSEGRRTRAIHGPLRLSRHPCRSPLSATTPFTLLKGRLESPDSFQSIKNYKPSLSICQASRTNSPVRRPSVGVAQGDARQDAERGVKGQGRPFATAPGAAPEGGEFCEAKPGCRGGLLFGYFLLARQEKVTRPAGRNLNHQATRQSASTRCQQAPRPELI